MCHRFYSFVSFFCVLLCLAGCQKNASPEAATEQSVVSEDVGESDPVRAAIVDVTNFFDGLAKIAEESGDDCDKLGNGMNDYLDKNKDKFAAALKIVGSIDDDSPEAENYKDELEKLDKVTGDDAPHAKALDKCSENEAVESFGLAFVAVMLETQEIEQQPSEDERLDAELERRKAEEARIAMEQEIARINELKAALNNDEPDEDKTDSKTQVVKKGPDKAKLLANLKDVNEKAKECGKDGTLKVQFNLSDNTAKNVSVVGGSLAGTETEKCVLSIMQDYNWTDGTALDVTFSYKF